MVLTVIKKVFYNCLNNYIQFIQLRKDKEKLKNIFKKYLTK